MALSCQLDSHPGGSRGQTAGEKDSLPTLDLSSVLSQGLDLRVASSSPALERERRERKDRKERKEEKALERSVCMLITFSKENFFRSLIIKEIYKSC